MATSCAPAVNKKLQVSAGDLRNQVVIERLEGTKTAPGGQNRQHQPIATVWCALTPLSGRFALQDGQPMTTGLFKLRMRYLPGLLNSDRINFGGRIMAIKEIMNIDERNFIHELTLQEDQSNG